MRLKLNGVNYHIRAAGQGDAVLLLHGFTGASQNWAKLMADLAADYRAVAPDLLGHGMTDAPPDPARCQIEAAAADLEALLARLEIGKVHLIGYSMGGRLGLFFALAYPHRLHSLILESASPGIEDPSEAADRRQSDQALAAWIEREGIAPFVDYWESLPLFESQKMMNAPERQALREQRLRNRVDGLANSLRGMGAGAQPSLWGRLSELSMPVQLIAGAADAKYVAIMQRMKAQMRTARLSVVAGAGHTVHLEQPQDFSALVRAHLSRFRA